MSDASPFWTLLAEASDYQLVDQVFDKIIAHYGDDLVNCPAEVSVVVLALTASGVIDNGGFEYLFCEWHFPRDPDFTRTSEAFRTVGLNRAYQAFQEAFALFPDGIPPRDPKLRERLYEQADETRRNEVNTEFWQDFREGGIRERIFAQYIREHALAFEHLYRQ